MVFNCSFLLEKIPKNRDLSVDFLHWLFYQILLISSAPGLSLETRAFSPIPTAKLKWKLNSDFVLDIPT